LAHHARKHLRRLPATNEFPSGSKQSFDSRANFLMAYKVAAVQRIQPSFYSFDKPRLVVGIVPDHGLRQFFGVTPGELGELFRLFRSEIDDHALLGSLFNAVNPENWTSPAKFASILTCEFKLPFHEYYPQ
jgi:hypothetical protein